MPLRCLVSLLFATLCSIATFAQTGVRGLVKTATGEALPYAAVVIKGSPRGTMANAEGRYELALPPGRYELTFQFLGYQTTTLPVEVSSGFVAQNATLQEQAVALREVQARVGKEDPAYSIMRRAIAKARFHQLQVQRFTARVYTKSSVTITDLPMEFLFRKQLKEAEKENNFKKGRPILNETVAEVSFSQPNTVRQRIIANRNSMLDEFMRPSQYYNVSFYAPRLAGAVGPVAPDAFAYYKFTYEGTFREGGVDVSKIRMTPKRRGEGVMSGTVYIIEDTWAIHSLDLTTFSGQGFEVQVRAISSPVQGVWMPVNQRYNVAGSFMGVTFTAQFVRSQTFSQFVLNPAFVEDVKVIDEKLDKPAETLSKGDIKGKKFAETVAKQKELSTKNLKQLVKEYEKQERAARKARKEDVAVVRNDSTVIDSLARKRSVMFWDSLRSVPLTTSESVAYVKSDSLRVVREGKPKTPADSAKRKSAKTVSAVTQILLGTYIAQPTRATSLTWTSPLGGANYNTVEGYAIEPRLRLRQRIDSVAQRRWLFEAVGRYRFGRQNMVGYGSAEYRQKQTWVGLDAGRYVFQYNPDNPIGFDLNGFTTLLFEQNLAKIYQKDFFTNLHGRTLIDEERLELTGSLEWARRRELANYSESPRRWIDWPNRSFTPNRPVNEELTGPLGTGFALHDALTLNLTASYRFGAVRYRIRNGVRQMIRRDDDAPVLTLNYRKGIAAGGSAVDYDFIQANVAHSIETGVRSRLSYNVAAGTFLNSRSVFFPDFKHFAGNEFFFQQGDPVRIFRLLPYYQFSTAQRFLEGHVLAEFRQLALTQLTLLRLAGLKENLFVHYLQTPTSRHYTEIGYGLDGLIPGVLPFFRVEVIGQVQGGRYVGTGFRVGTTLRFGR